MANLSQYYEIVNTTYMISLFPGFTLNSSILNTVKSGCPLSAYLFIIVIEVLAHKIRNDPNIKGIKIGNNEIKISLLADDMTLLLQELTSVNNVLNTLAYFHKCSGLKINLDKSKIKNSNFTQVSRSTDIKIKVNKIYKPLNSVKCKDFY